MDGERKIIIVDAVHKLLSYLSYTCHIGVLLLINRNPPIKKINTNNTSIMLVLFFMHFG
jgi:hypothetical protein